MQKYGRAFLLALGAGSILACNFLVFTLGRSNAAEGDLFGGASPFVRWPLALVVAGLALAAMLRWAPKRRQPAWSWLMFGAAFCVTAWALVTLLLGFALHLSSSFGDTYGPLAGIVALQIWTLLSAIAIFFGAAVAAQLEAVRAGAPEAARRAGARSARRSRDSTASYAS